MVYILNFNNYLGLAILCYVHFVFVIVWLSVQVQLSAWKDLSPK